MASSATWVAGAPKRDVPASRRRHSPDRPPSRFLGVGPTFALVVLEVAVFAVSGWLIGSFTISGSDGPGVSGAHALPTPRVVVPTMPHPGKRPPRTPPLATSPIGVHTEDVAYVVRFVSAPSPSRASTTRATGSAVPPTATLALPTTRPRRSAPLRPVSAAAASRHDTKSSHPVRVSGWSVSQEGGKTQMRGKTQTAESVVRPRHVHAPNRSAIGAQHTGSVEHRLTGPTGH